MNLRTDTPHTDATSPWVGDFQSTFGTMAVGLMFITPHGSLVAANPAYCRLVGKTLAELNQMDLTTLVHPEDRAARASLIWKLLDGSVSSTELKERYVKSNGDVVFVHSAFSLTRPRDSTAPNVVIVARSDMRERNEQKQFAGDSDRLFDTLYSIGDGVMTVDLEERVVFMNRVAEELTGWVQNDAHGKTLTDIFQIIDQSTRETRESPVANVLRTGEIEDLIQPTLLITKSGVENLIADSVSRSITRNTTSWARC